MKKIISIIILTMIVFNLSNLRAEEQPKNSFHEFNLGYGLAYTTTSFWYSGFSFLVVDIFSFTSVQIRDIRPAGCFSLSYGYHFNPHIAIRFSAGLDPSTASYYRVVYGTNGPLDTIAEKTGKLNTKSVLANIEVEWGYMHKEWVRLYGYAGLGLDLFVETYKPQEGVVNAGNQKTVVFPFFNFHVCPIGIKFGKKFGGMFEFGLGYNGIVRAGIYYRI
jgi:hypothetical protein